MTDLPMATTAMLTDRYELTMLDAARTSGVAGHRAVFEVFARTLPAGRRYGVVAGTERVLDAIERFRFDPDDLAYLAETGAVSRSTADWLAAFSFCGEVDGVREGELYGPNTPILTVDAPFAEAVLLETVILSIFNHDTAVASAAARMVGAAGGKDLIEMGGRRTHEAAAIAAARAAYLAGFAATSNLAAGEEYAVPTVGTAAHAFTLAHTDETAAFAAQLAALGPGTTLLVDTYDVAEGIRHAVAAANAIGAAGPGAIRIDSGDLLVEAERGRALLDELGARDTHIVVTGDLDEHAIARLEAAGAPVDGYGVGTQVVTGSGRPTANFVYKLVAIADGAGADEPLRPVAKRSAGKATVGGRKRVHRVLDAEGRVVADRFVVDERAHVHDDDIAAATAPDTQHLVRELQVPLIRKGLVVHRPPLDDVRAHHRLAMAELAPGALALDDGPPAFALEPEEPTTNQTGDDHG
jgi:nicotinate phosphoribosyltransferase